MSKEFSDISTATARLNQFDQMMEKQRADLNKSLETAEKQTMRREADTSKLLRAELDEISKKLLRLDEITELNKKFKERVHEEQRLNLAIQDMQAKAEEVVTQNENILITQKAIDEARRQDAKRIADLQGEMASVRKRADDAREKTILHSDNIRSLENRVNELVQTENSRLEAQASFLEQQTTAQMERDKAWKDWQETYNTFKKQAENMEAQMTALDDSIRAAKRAQDAYNELNQKLERRIAEVSEMQRLGEDRIRQEWVAFKADEQKRWTGHSLSQEEAMRDLRKDMDKLEQRVTSLDDASQTMQDQLHQTTDTTEKQLQELMNISNEWLTAYERIMGHGKTKAKKSTK
ncbi:MAG: hypothetical protein HY258_03400 [Chloroflexi bacterium]|nr:hypothetical protein [Chloroflexota bacterium]